MGPPDESWGHTVHTDNREHIAEDVCDLGPQPVRQDAPLVESLRHELTHLSAPAWCEACVKGRGREAPHQDQRHHGIQPVDFCETMPVRPTRRISPGPPLGNASIGESSATPLPKRAWSVNVDDGSMVAAIAEVTEVCEEPQLDWEARLQ